MTEAFTHDGFQIMYGEEVVTPQEICDTLRDYYLSMEVLREIIDMTFPDMEVPDPYMARLKRKADDAIKRWKDRLPNDES